jgi:hypothetical protein
MRDIYGLDRNDEISASVTRIATEQIGRETGFDLGSTNIEASNAIGVRTAKLVFNICAKMGIVIDPEEFSAVIDEEVIQATVYGGEEAAHDSLRTKSLLEAIALGMSEDKVIGDKEDLNG